MTPSPARTVSPPISMSSTATRRASRCEGPVDVDAVAQHMPMKRAGQPLDVAYAVAYLASEEAGYLTGQTLSVNGGRYLA
ncbi:SDR family oxidoreductase [Actinoplanes sp. NPDC026619]|uniref:SDR family oxidoreductase n=1 Tax=Actinoplanes sp. NPDC026619 TaxID=3155798 RepID=UPI0033C4CE0C